MGTAPRLIGEGQEHEREWRLPAKGGARAVVRSLLITTAHKGWVARKVADGGYGDEDWGMLHGELEIWSEVELDGSISTRVEQRESRGALLGDCF